jgi:hypothetical protein
MAACSTNFIDNDNEDGVWQYSAVGGTMLLLPSGMPA